jgi:acyl carrier protein
MSDTAERIYQIFRGTELTLPAELSRSTTWDDIPMDSLDYAEIAMEIEDEFGIDMSEEDMVAVTNMGELTDFVEKKVAAGA